MSDLSLELTADILSRLPVKPLLQLRCVSKPWCALIDSPDFIKLHLNRSIETNANISIIFRYFYSMDFDSLDHAVQLEHPLKSKGFGSWVVGSCDGLLCLANKDNQIVLWNFSTRKHHELPFAPIEFPPGDKQIVLRNFSTRKNHKLPFVPIEFPSVLSVWAFIGHGFGYDSVRDDYKLVRIVQCYGKIDDPFYYGEVRVYSMKSNSWRRIQDFPYYLPYNPGLLHNAVFVRGAVHWVVCREPTLEKGNLIAAFDLGAEEYRLVPQPDYLDDEDFRMSLGSLGGCLCINCRYVGRDRVDGWVMKEYGVKESWTKLFSVEYPNLYKKFDSVAPLAYSKTGGEVVMKQDNAELLWFDLETKRVKNVRIPGSLMTFCEDQICVESLVPPRSNAG